MTPLQISMLLHFHCSPTPFPGGYHSAQSEAIQYFQREKLVEVPTNLDAVVLTERGRAYVQFVQQMPLPIANWTIAGPWQPSMPPASPSPLP